MKLLYAPNHLQMIYTGPTRHTTTATTTSTALPFAVRCVHTTGLAKQHTVKSAILRSTVLIPGNSLIPYEVQGDLYRIGMMPAAVPRMPAMGR